MKSALIALLGRPSSGKSSILNAVCGHKIAIVAASPQTTRNTVRGILTEDRGQLVFLDTPGFHISGKKLNRYLRRLAEHTVEESDLILYVVDTQRKIGDEEEALMRLVAESGKPAVVALNKTDLGTRKIEYIGKSFAQNLPEAAVYPVSARTGFGIGDLKTGLFLHSPQGEAMYPEEYYTDQDPEFRISEIIREQVVQRVREELPHAVYVEIQDSEISEDSSTLWVRAFVFVERESQKGIIVGKGGEMIKKIRVESESQLAELFPYRVKLDLRVKTAPQWHKDDILLRRLIH
jgi:GTP-binding protein Era